jgi:hypothetical protein
VVDALNRRNDGSHMIKVSSSSLVINILGFQFSYWRQIPLSFSGYSTFHINAMIGPLDDIWVKKVQMLDT